MGNDKTADSLVIRDCNFTNQNWESEAKEMEEEWDAQTTFVDWAENHQFSRTTYQKIYKRHMGIPPEEFNDGLDDERTIGQIKAAHGKLKTYYEDREEGEIDSSLPYIVDLSESDDSRESVPELRETSQNVVSFERAVEMAIDCYRMGLADGRNL
ncbi:hypothetical protein C491_13252 [Natronococcus amylolyticus DSM 10524]|uniref:Uncharacterized protein n=1 Tax=Natronococcus amylolyticus DSM 10524 TaxID=1227497 RepID=L9X7C7_9EURY|nr:hypothetical protein [Natronococcus amylolyticus]ELY56508.1 hypothetical protein C491_13252 [Natronococcus amylolyticus DSM 10524]